MSVPYFAFTDAGSVAPLGVHADFSEACEAADRLTVAVVWIFTESALREFVASATDCLGGAL